MSLPSSYDTAHEYLKSLLIFLREYKWLYNYPNTHILAYNILDNVPQDWALYFKDMPLDQLNNLALGIHLETCPESLSNFLKNIKDLRPTEINNIQFNKVQIQQRSVGAKKSHEIALFAPIIEKVCKENDVGIVIDVGSGRGYLTQKLNELYNFKVLGLEGCEEKLNSARIYQEKYFPHSKDNVKYEHHFITSESEKVIEEMVRRHFGKIDDWVRGKNVAIVGLHACADLGVDIMDILSQLSMAKVLLLMPCCYHRLKTSGDEEVCNFPKSDIIRSLSKDMNMSGILGIPFLRLSAQERAGVFALKSVQQHETHARLCLYRAVLQLVVEKSNYTISRLKRKSGKCLPSGDAISFHEYLDNLQNTHSISSVVGESPNNSADEAANAFTARNTRESNLTGNYENIAASYLFKQEMLATWATYKDRTYLVEVLACFQAAIQSVCENLVLLDRVMYLQERGLECWVEQVTDDVKSPRCHALIAVKR